LHAWNDKKYTLGSNIAFSYFRITVKDISESSKQRDEREKRGGEREGLRVTTKREKTISSERED